MSHTIRITKIVFAFIGATKYIPTKAYINQYGPTIADLNGIENNKYGISLNCKS